MESTAVTTQVSCAYCAEPIAAAAKKCKHCGEILDPQMREIELLKSQRAVPQQVFMNAGNVGNSTPQLRQFRHRWHIVLTIVTLGWWIIPWILIYVLRNRSVYF